MPQTLVIAICLKPQPSFIYLFIYLLFILNLNLNNITETKYSRFYLPETHNNLNMCPKQENSKDVDVYGQYQPQETESMIAESLHAFQETLDKTPPSEKQALSQAEEHCSELLTEGFKLMFLRCELFDIDVSIMQTPWSVVLCCVVLCVVFNFLPPTINSIFFCKYTAAISKALCQILGRSSGSLWPRKGI